MSKYLFFDMDGTLISPSTGRIPQSVIDGINAAKKNGHKCFICTGRSYSLGLEHQDEVEMPGIVFCNGAGIAYEHRILYTQNIHPDTVYHIMDIVNWLGGEFRLLTTEHMYLNEEAYISNGRQWTKYTGESWQQLYEKRGILFISQYRGEPVQKIDVCFSNALTADIFFSRVPEDVSLVMAGGYFAGMGNLGGELTAKGISKATGIQTVLNMYGADLPDSYVFGDSSNDLEMIRLCPNSTAMGNGTKEVQEAADFVTAHCDCDGIAKALKHYGLI